MIKMMLSLLLATSLCWAQEQDEENSVVSNAKPASRSTVNMGLFFMQWNEDLNLKQGTFSVKDVANYSGMALSLEKEVTHYRWGWALALMAGAGKANGGGNNDFITYDETKQSWTLFGVTPRVFYRVTGRVNFGFSFPIFAKQLTWPSEDPAVEVDSGTKVSTGGQADLNLRLSRSLWLYQGLGALSASGSTLWRVGLIYSL